MNLEHLEDAWRSQVHGKLPVDTQRLVEEMRRRDTDFRKMIFWRDTRELVVGLLLIPIWIYLGVHMKLPWTWYLEIPASLFVLGFMWVDRIRQKGKQGQPSGTVDESLQQSIENVSHQVWLLRNVFWWYLLPSQAALSAFFIHIGLQAKAGVVAGLITTMIPLTITALITWGVYQLNQLAVRKELEPRLQELQRLKSELESVL